MNNYHNYDNVNPYDNFYPSFINEPISEDKSMKNNYVETNDCESNKV